MMTKTKKTAIITLFIALLLSIAAAVALTFAPKQTFADSLIPEGYTVAPYEVLDITENEWTGSAPGKSVIALNNEKAARFKMTMNSAAGWSTSFGMFTSDSRIDKSPQAGFGCFYVTLNHNSSGTNIKLFVNDQTGSTLISGEKTFELSEELATKLKTAGSVLNVEIGGVGLLNGDNPTKGILIYFDIDGERLVEYYYDNDNAKGSVSFSEGNFYCQIHSSSVKLEEISSVTAITSDNATVAFTEESYDCSFAAAEPKPVVTVSKTVNGIIYPQIVNEKYYDVSYENNTTTGTATATVTFKGIYSGTASAEFATYSALDAYENPLKNYDGYYLDTEYTVKNVEESKTATSTGNNDSQIDRIPLEGSDVVRFTITHTDGNFWDLCIALFANTYYSTDDNSGMIMFQIWRDTAKGNMGYTIYKTNADTVKQAKTFDNTPEWLDLTADGCVNTIEAGGIDVFNAGGEYAGKFFYLEIDGVRIMEFVYITDIQFTCDNFAIKSGSNNFTISSYEINEENAVSLDGRAKVEIASATSGESVEITPVVYAAPASEHGTYVQLIEPKYYDVTYTNNAASGTATATLTFKDKYSGTATKEYFISAITLTSDTDENQTVLALSGASVDLGRLSISGKTFIGYDVDGALKETVTVVATAGATEKFVTADFYTVEGASIKADGTRGLRFDTRIKTSEISRLEAYGTVTFGTKVYSTALNKSGEKDATKWAAQDEDGYSEYRLVLHNFESHDDYYTEKFSAKGYVKITSADGETIKVYVDSNEFERSMADVAEAYINNAGIEDTDPSFDANVYTGIYNNKYYAQAQGDLDYIVTVAAKKQSGITE